MKLVIITAIISVFLALPAPASESQPDEKYCAWSLLSLVADHDRFIKEWLERAQANTREGQHLRDSLNLHWLAKFHPYSVASVMWGNSFQKLPISEKSQFELYAQVLKKLLTENYLVLYDGDTKIAPYVRKLLRERGIGIFSSKPPEGDGLTLQISDPYLRMTAFQKVDRLISNTNSIAGFGILVGEKGIDYLVDPTEQWTFFPKKWEREIAGGLGLQFSDSLKVLSKLSDFRLPVFSRWHGPLPEVSYESIILGLSSFEFGEIQDRLQLLEEGETQLAKIPGGAVIFGSSTNASEFTNLVYQSARHLAQHGIPVVTGGSGGFMAVANAGAWDAGGHSIGIPLSGKFRLSTEKNTASEYQSLTLASDTYHSRIPLLLHQRALVVLAPGGSGTMRELACALVAMSAAPLEKIPHLVFLSSKYYRPLAEALVARFPKTFGERVHLIDSDFEWESLLSQIEADFDGRSELKRLKTEVIPTPRNERTKYPKSS